MAWTHRMSMLIHRYRWSIISLDWTISLNRWMIRISMFPKCLLFDTQHFLSLCRSSSPTSLRTDTPGVSIHQVSIKTRERKRKTEKINETSFVYLWDLLSFFFFFYFVFASILFTHWFLHTSLFVLSPSLIATVQDLLSFRRQRRAQRERERERKKEPLPKRFSCNTLVDKNVFSSNQSFILQSLVMFSSISGPFLCQSIDFSLSRMILFHNQISKLSP